MAAALIASKTALKSDLTIVVILPPWSWKPKLYLRGALLINIVTQKFTCGFTPAILKPSSLILALCRNLITSRAVLAALLTTALALFTIFWILLSPRCATWRALEAKFIGALQTSSAALASAPNAPRQICPAVFLTTFTALFAVFLTNLPTFLKTERRRRSFL